MALLSDISDAARDEHLRDRMTSAAAELGIPDPFTWVDSHARELATAPVVAGSPDTVASVYAYARDTRAPAPGANPAAVNDDYIRHAVQYVREEETTP